MGQPLNQILTTISMVPLAILVGICKAWKKLVFSGPRPVFWAGMVTGHGAMAPGRAGALFLFWSSLSRTSHRSSLVKTKPTLLTMWGSSLWTIKAFVKVGSHTRASLQKIENFQLIWQNIQCTAMLETLMQVISYRSCKINTKVSHMINDIQRKGSIVIFMSIY